MRFRFFMIGIAAASGLLANNPAEAKWGTCSKAYQNCKKLCIEYKARTGRACASGLCEGYRSSCMKTGVWHSPNYYEDNMQKR
jgi:hypothetical protein